MRFRYAFKSMNTLRQHFFSPIEKGGHQPEIEVWCRDQFGEPANGLDQGRWNFHTPNYYWFRDEMDAFAFRVRWC